MVITTVDHVPSAPIPDRTLRRRLAVGTRIRDARERARLTQEEVADRAGLDRKTISRIENGVMAVLIDHLLDIADALGVPPSSLLPDTTVR
jgi:transcriptional regulator with XRE-family HTH domain